MQTREVVVSLTSESVVGGEAMPGMEIGEKRNIGKFVEKHGREIEVDGIVVETTKGETERIGYIRDIDRADEIFTIEDKAEAREALRVARKIGKGISDSIAVHDAMSQLAEAALGPDNEKSVEISSSAWHGLWAVVNLHECWGDVIDKIEVEKKRFVAISLKRSPESGADGKIMVGPLGTYAYVLRKGEEEVSGYGGEGTRLVLFPDEEAMAKFSQFGWKSNEENGEDE